MKLVLFITTLIRTIKLKLNVKLWTIFTYLHTMFIKLGYRIFLIVLFHKIFKEYKGIVATLTPF